VKLAIAQGQRWQRREPFALIEIASTNGMRATLEEMEARGRREARGSSEENYGSRRRRVADCATGTAA
jgi:hypothetical protein